MGKRSTWQAQHQDLTSRLIDTEKELNDRVYKLFGLNQDDIRLLEDHCRKSRIDYPFGEP